MELNDIRAFVHIAELGSVSAAARALRLPKSTISRALMRLEASTGSVLVERSTRHLRLTDAGVLLRPYAERIIADVEEAATALDGFGGVARGTIRINAPFTFAVGLLSPMLPSFLAAYPEVRVILDIDNCIIDMAIDAADLVIRIGSLPDTDLIARKLTTIELWTCASPEYLATHGTPASVSDLESHVLICGFDRTMNWAFGDPNGSTAQIEARPGNVVPEPAALAIVLAGGAGIGRLPDFLARKPVESGTLIRLFAETKSDMVDVHALYPSHRSLSAKVRVFIDALAAHLLSGKQPAKLISDALQ
jgi:DNA-binding transcriptional LysR family regulator